MLFSEYNFLKLNFIEPASPLMYGIIELHDHIFFFLNMILFLVLFLLATTLNFFDYAINSRLNRYLLSQSVKFNYNWLRLNHSTTLEVVWTVLPSIILILIAVPSFALLYATDELVDPAVTIQVIGHQWYWSYEYNDISITTVKPLINTAAIINHIKSVNNGSTLMYLLSLGKSVIRSSTNSGQPVSLNTQLANQLAFSTNNFDGWSILSKVKMLSEFKLQAVQHLDKFSFTSINSLKQLLSKTWILQSFGSLKNDYLQHIKIIGYCDLFLNNLSPKKLHIFSSIFALQKAVILNKAPILCAPDGLSKLNITLFKSIKATLLVNNGNFEFDSYMRQESDLIIGEHRLYETDFPLVLPRTTHIRFMITADDVIHSWSVPALGIKVDAVPGRINHAHTFIKRSGMFYGQCSELCGVNHAFMPIQIIAFEPSMYYDYLRLLVLNK